MQSKYIKQAFVLFIFSLLAAIGTYVINEQKQPENIQGERVFKTNTQNAATIELRAPNFKITLDKIDNLWSIREADSYYADYEIVKSLEDFINKAKILKKAPINKAEEKHRYQNGLEINIYNANQEKQDSIILSLQEKIANNISAKIQGKTGNFIIEMPRVLPLNIKNWLQQPLLNIKTEDIEKISINNLSATRRQGEDFFRTDNGKLYSIRNIEKILNYLPFEDVKSAQNFDETQYTALKTYKITTKSGLIYDLTLYGKNSEIWVKEKISTTTLPTTQTSDYIKRNEFLYNYWYFKLPPELGSSLIRERLE